MYMKALPHVYDKRESVLVKTQASLGYQPQQIGHTSQTTGSHTAYPLWHESVAFPSQTFSSLMTNTRQTVKANRILSGKILMPWH